MACRSCWLYRLPAFSRSWLRLVLMRSPLVYSDKHRILRVVMRMLILTLMINGRRNHN